MPALTRSLVVLASSLGSIGIVWLAFGGRATLVSAVCAVTAGTLVPALVMWWIPRPRP